MATTGPRSGAEEHAGVETRYCDGVRDDSNFGKCRTSGRSKTTAIPLAARSEINPALATKRRIEEIDLKEWIAMSGK
jgi:hypothetical protein